MREARRRRAFSSVSTLSSENPSFSSWEAISGSFTSRSRTSMSWSCTRSARVSVIGCLSENLAERVEVGGFEQLLPGARQADRPDDFGDEPEVDGDALRL